MDSLNELNVSYWNRTLKKADKSRITQMARHSDLICCAADDFSVMREFTDACHDYCPQVWARFGERCDMAEVAFSIPGQTARLSETFGNPDDEQIEAAQELGVDTAWVTSFVSALCIRLLLGNGKGADLFDIYRDAPLFALGLRRRWIFQGFPRDQVRSIVLVGAPTGVDR